MRRKIVELVEKDAKIYFDESDGSLFITFGAQYINLDRDTSQGIAEFVIDWQPGDTLVDWPGTPGPVDWKRVTDRYASKDE